MKRNVRNRLGKPAFALLIALILACVAIAPAMAENYPDKPITIVVPTKPGGSTDIAARAMMGATSKLLNGQPIVVVNRPGGNELVGAKFVAESKPDGYTLLVGWGGAQHTFGRHVGELPFELFEDFKPVFGVLGYSSCLAVPIDSPFNSLADLVKYAKENPGKLRWTHSSVNGTHWILGQTFFDMAGISLTEVPNGEGGAQARNMVAGGQVNVGVFASFLAKDFVGTKLKVLGVCYSERDSFFPDVPTFSEQGFDITSFDFKLIAAPAGVSDDKIAILHQIFSEALKTQKAQDMLKNASFLPLGWSPQECLEKIRAVDAEHEKFAEKMGMK